MDDGEAEEVRQEVEDKDVDVPDSIKSAEGVTIDADDSSDNVKLKDLEYLDSMGIVEVSNESTRNFEPMDMTTNDDKDDAPARQDAHFEPLQMDEADIEETPEEEEKRIKAELKEFAQQACKISQVLLLIAAVVFTIIYFKAEAAIAVGKLADEQEWANQKVITKDSSPRTALASVLDSIGIQPKYSTKLHNADHRTSILDTTPAPPP